MIETSAKLKAVREETPEESKLESLLNKTGLSHVVARSPTLPLRELDNRHFEILAFMVLRKKAGPAIFYDQVSLLREGRDWGRDLLLRRGAITGIVQCKRLAASMGPEDILTEILRLALYAVRDPSLRPAPNTRYQLWTASGLTKRAQHLIDSASASTMRAELPALFDAARKGIASLAQHPDAEQDAAECAHAIDIATSLVLEHVGPEAITSDLADLPAVRRLFFRSPDDGPPSASLSEVDELLEVLKAEQLGRLKACGRLDFGTYVPRAGLDEAFAEFLADSSRAFIVVGGSGQGKTSWVARLLAEPPEGRRTIMVPAEQIAGSDRTPVDTITRNLTARPMNGVSPERIDQSLWEWLDAHNRILVVDGLDRIQADARGTISEWLTAAAEMTGKTSVRLVVTSRREAWTALAGMVPLLKRISSTPEGVGKGEPSFELAALKPFEAKAIYAAYGVTPEQHRGARLSSPSLIASFSRLRSAASDIVTRLDVLDEEASAIEIELKHAGHGRLAASDSRSWIGDQLLKSTDGWFRTSGSGNLSPVLEAMADNDRLVHRDGLVRMEADDMAELLLSRRLDLDQLLANLDARYRDPIFMGAASLTIARLERDGEADAALERLLEGAPFGKSARLDAVAGAILELRSPELVIHRICDAIALWNVKNNLLRTSRLGSLIDAVDLPGGERLRLMLSLARGEEADDWREKYWRGTQYGRIVTPFAFAAERAAAADPDGIFSTALKLSVEEDDLLSSVGRTLLFRAALASPASILTAAWAARFEAPNAFGVAMQAAPLVAAKVLSEIDLTIDGPHCERFVVDLLWKIAHHQTLADADDVKSSALRDAADRLLNWIEVPELRVDLLVIRLGAEPSQDLVDELQRSFTFVEDHHYWAAVKVMGGDTSRHVLGLLAGEEPHRDALSLLRSTSLHSMVGIDAEQVSDLLVAFASGSESQSYAAASAVEGMLYSQSFPLPSQVEKAALKLSASAHDRTRMQLIYYAASKEHGDVRPEEIAFRERMLDVLIAHETGGNLSLLVWKIVESAMERPTPQRRIDDLVRRFGLGKFHDAIGFADSLPEADGLNLYLGSGKDGERKEPFCFR
jgi:hypothetical protein